MFVWLPIFNALTQNKLSNPTKSPHCLPVCEVMSITSRKKGGKGREMKREGGWSEGGRIRNMSLGFLLLLGGKLSGYQSPWTHYLSMSAWWICNFPWLLSSPTTHACKITRAQAVSSVLPGVWDTVGYKRFALLCSLNSSIYDAMPWYSLFIVGIIRKKL